MAGQSDNRYGDRDSKPLTGVAAPTTSTPGYIGQTIIDINGDSHTLVRIESGLYYWYKDGDFSYITTPSISNTTGSLVVGGGIGVGGDIHVAGVEVTITDTNKHKIYLSDGTDALFRRQTHYWNGSAFVADKSYFFGLDAGANNTGNNSSGFGASSAQNNTGSNASFFGYFSGQNNAGIYSAGIGQLCLQNNTGVYCNGVGGLSLLNNTGTNGTGIGYSTLRNNNWNNVIEIGYHATAAFVENVASVKSFTDTEITANTIVITSHGFGTTGRKINLKFKTTAGTPPTGLVHNITYQFTITDADTLTLAGIGTNASANFAGTLTNSIDTSNSISIGSDTSATKKNQIILGNSSMTETIIYGASREYADNAAAVAAGMSIGSLYRTGDLLKIVHA